MHKGVCEKLCGVRCGGPRRGWERRGRAGRISAERRPSAFSSPPLERLQRGLRGFMQQPRRRASVSLPGREAPASPAKRQPMQAPSVAAQDRSLSIYAGPYWSRAIGHQNLPCCSRIVVITTTKMRMRGLEPPPGRPDTDLNRARLPIPPHPRVGERRRYRTCHAGTGGGCQCCPGEQRSDGLPVRTCSGRFASLDRADCAPLSSRGLGRRPLMAETRVRIPVAVLRWARVYGAFRVLGAARARIRASRSGRLRMY